MSQPPTNEQPTLPNPNVNHMTRWLIPVPYACRFNTDMQNNLHIEFKPGREQEIADYLIQHLSFHTSQAALKREADVKEHARQILIQAAEARRNAANAQTKVIAAPVHQPFAPVAPLAAPAQPESSSGETGISQFDNFASEQHEEK